MMKSTNWQVIIALLSSCTLFNHCPPMTQFPHLHLLPVLWDVFLLQDKGYKILHISHYTGKKKIHGIISNLECIIICTSARHLHKNKLERRLSTAMHCSEVLDGSTGFVKVDKCAFTRMLWILLVTHNFETTAINVLHILHSCQFVFPHHFYLSVCL